MQERLLVFLLTTLQLASRAAADASCDNQVISLEEKTITASSWLNNDTVANNAGLSLTNSSWCAAEDDAAPYLQVNLGRRKHGICAIATQGDPTADRWVETYQIQTSTNGATWTDYEEGEAVRDFLGNSDRSTLSQQTLYEGVVAKYVRILPKAWHILPCLRIQLYGIDSLACGRASLGVENPSDFPDHRMTATSSRSAEYAPYKARLNGATCWQPQNTTDEYLQLDLGGQYFVCAFKTQGNGNISLGEWTKHFQISLSSDNSLVRPFELNGRIEKFIGSIRADGSIKNSVSDMPRAKFIRFHPVAYEKYPSLRLEVYGALQGCRSSLGIEDGTLDDAHITAQPIGTAAHNARLYGPPSGCNSSTNAGDLEVDLGGIKAVTGLAIQGDAGEGPVQVEYRYGSSHWQQTRGYFTAGEHISPNDVDKVRALWFPTPIVASFVRVKAPSYPLPTGPCFRIDLYGCDSILRPRISLKSQNLQPNEGSFVDVVCEVSSQPHPVIQWWLGDTEVTSLSGGVIQSNDSVNGLSTSTLRVNFTSEQDIASNYDCVRRNSSTEVVCTAFRCVAFYEGIKSRTLAVRSAVVTVKLAAPKIAQELKDSTLLLGSKLNLSCQDLADPTLPVYWTKNGSPNIINAEMMDGNKTLIIEKVDLSDEGTYTCMVKNAVGTATSSADVKVQVRSQLYVPKPHTLRLKHGEGNITIDCYGYGKPLPTVEWKRNGLMIENVTKYSREYDAQTVQLFQFARPSQWNVTNRLYLRPGGVTYEEAGNYTCEVFNGVATNASVEQTIRVSFPPHLTVSPQESLIAEKGEDVNLTCLARGYPPPVYMWTKDGLRVDGPHENHNRSLVLRNVTSADEGLYVCWAGNDAGEVSTATNLTVHAVPSITQPLPPSDVAISGSTVRLTCQGVSIPPPRVHWTKDNATVQRGLVNTSGDSVVTSHLTIPDVMYNDRGEYACVFSNYRGNVSSSLRLEVHVLPQFAIILVKSLVAEEGDDVNLTCSASGRPLPHYAWTKNGLTIQGSPQLGNDNRSLVLRNVTSADDGLYTCLAVNEAGNVSTATNLTVHVAPSITQSPPHSEVAISGSSVRLTCQGVSIPPPRVHWTKDNATVQRGLVNTSGDSVVTSHLTIPDVMYKDRGEYACVFSNYRGNVSSSVRLDVHVPPHFTVSLEEAVVAEEGDIVNLTCSASAYPQPVYAWTKSGLTIDGSGQLENHNRSLVLRNVTSADDGLYTCWAVNEAGNVSTATNLTVHAAPSITRRLSNRQVAISGSTVRLTCQGVSIPPPRVHWTKDNATVQWGLVNTSGDSVVTSHLTIPDVMYKDRGEYACVFSNYRGRVFSSVRLDVQVSPQFIIKLSRNATAEKGDSINLTCVANGNPEPFYFWTKNGLAIDGWPQIQNHNRSLVLRNVTSADDGLYTCLAVNEVGNASTATNVTVHAEPSITKPLLHGEVVFSGSSVKLTCQGVSIPPPRVHWTKDNATVQRGLVNTSGDSVVTSHLTIPDVMYNDRGEYACVFSNYRGSVSSSLHLKVYVRIQITEPPNEEKKPLGNETSMVCSARGRPLPAISWLKDGHNLTRQDRVNITDAVHRENATTSSILNIKNLERGDSANYSCVAKNQLESAREDAKLTVLEKAKLGSLIIATIASREALLEWEVSFDGNSPVMNFLVTHNNSMGSVAHTVSGEKLAYTVQNLTPDTAYKFEVWAYNSQGPGKAVRVFGRTSEAAPSKPRDLKVTDLTATSALLAWRSPLKRNGRLRMYRIRISDGRVLNVTQQLDREDMTFSVTGLQPYTHYDVSVAAVTVAHGEFCDAVSITTDPSSPPKPEDKLGHNETTSTTVIIFVPTFSDENGKILFYQVRVTRIPNKIARKFTQSVSEKTMSYEDAHKADTTSTYIAFQFKGSEYPQYQRFTVGNEERSDASRRDERQVTTQYYNGPLQAQTEYEIRVRAFTSEKTYTDTSPTGFTTEPESGPREVAEGDPSPNTWLLVGLSLVAFFVLIACIIIICIIVRRRKASEKASVRDLTGLDVAEMQGLRAKEPNDNYSEGEDEGSDYHSGEEDKSQQSLTKERNEQFTTLV